MTREELYRIIDNQAETIRQLQRNERGMVSVNCALLQMLGNRAEVPMAKLNHIAANLFRMRTVSDFKAETDTLVISLQEEGRSR